MIRVAERDTPVRRVDPTAHTAIGKDHLDRDVEANEARRERQRTRAVRAKPGAFRRVRERVVLEIRELALAADQRDRLREAPFNDRPANVAIRLRDRRLRRRGPVVGVGVHHDQYLTRGGF